MTGAVLAEAGWTPTLAEFRSYARLSGDDNPIHLDPAFAARHPFGRVVSHGMLIHARLRALAKARGLSAGGPLRITFPAPAYATEPLRLTLAPAPEGLRARATRADGTLVYDGSWARHPEEDPGAPEAAAALGESARLTHRFTAADLAEFAALSGGEASAEVPDALIPGLFSCLLGTRLPGPGTGWLKQELIHSAQAACEELLSARVMLIRRRPEGKLADLMCICTGNEGRLLCRGRALMLLSSWAALQS